MVNLELVKFVKEARKRGFDDSQIKEVLLRNKWDINEIELAFSRTKQPLKFKNKICIYLDSNVVKLIEKRANKNMFTISEQIEDILRRSAINSKKLNSQTEKLDDMFISLFSRKSRK